MMKLKSNLKKHISIKRQIFCLLIIINQLLIHKLFIHLGYLTLIQQVLLILIGKMINKKNGYKEFIKYFLFVTSIFLVLYKYSFLFNTDYRVCVKLSFYINKISL